MNTKIIKIPSGPDWQSKLTNEERACLPGIEIKPNVPPKSEFEWKFLHEKDIIDINRRLRLNYIKLNNDKRGTVEALSETIKRITESAIIPRSLHIYPWRMKRKEKNGRRQ